MGPGVEGAADHSGPFGGKTVGKEGVHIDLANSRLLPVFFWLDPPLQLCPSLCPLSLIEQ